MTGLPMTVRIPHGRPAAKIAAPTAQYTKRHLLNPEQVPFYIPLFRISASFFAKKEQNFRIPVNYSIPSRYPWGTTSYASAR